jgi:protein SCO1/2
MAWLVCGPSDGRRKPGGDPGNPLTTQKTLVAVALALIALVGGIVVATRLQAPRAVTLQSGVLLGERRPIAEFTLADQDGRPFGNAQLRGHWTLVFAGFTQCPDVCPTTLGLMNAVARQLGPRAPAMVFLSVDPERDTPPVLQAYVRHFGSAIAGVTGPRAALDTLCASLGIAYVKIPGATAADYTVDHSAALVLVDPEGRVAGYFPPPLKADTLAADLSGIAG